MWQTFIISAVSPLLKHVDCKQYENKNYLYVLPSTRCHSLGFPMENDASSTLPKSRQQGVYVL
jgi:hypothetical protein